MDTSSNARNQMKRLTIPSVADWEYKFSTTANNGRITGMKDWITGEDVTYQYDALNRLISASATGSSPWSQTYGYDGFGNLTQKGASNWTVDPLTNRLIGVSYDSNGNQNLNGSTQYDIANRLKTWDGGELYGYTHDNRRAWKYKPGWGDELTFWGVEGKRQASYKLEWQGPAGGTYLRFVEQTRNVWFGGKLIRTGAVSAQASVVTDRLGSVRVSKVGSNTERLDYYPYGDEKPSASTQDREKFATYYRDSTGLDYADQRYYRWEWGRFGTPDPARDGWNWYAYAQTEPIGHVDPSGLCKIGGMEYQDGSPPCPVGTSVTVTGTSPIVPTILVPITLPLDWLFGPVPIPAVVEPTEPPIPIIPEEITEFEANQDCHDKVDDQTRKLRDKLDRAFDFWLSTRGSAAVGGAKGAGSAFISMPLLPPSGVIAGIKRVVKGTLIGAIGSLITVPINPDLRDLADFVTDESIDERFGRIYHDECDAMYPISGKKLIMPFLIRP